LLQESDVDVNKVDKAGISPLAEAAECGHTQLAQMLIDAGANVEIAGTNDGMTALLLAAQAVSGMGWVHLHVVNGVHTVCTTATLTPSS
jgi:ankyrin repeat protein